MKLRKDKKSVLLLLKQINKLVSADKVIDNTLHSTLYEEFSSHVQDGSWMFYDFHNVLNAVYLHMVGKTEKDVYEMFVGPLSNDTSKPVGWYSKSSYHDTLPGSALPPSDEHSGFICDSINMLILDATVKPKEKYRLLRWMFRDLVQLKKQHKKQKDKKNAQS